MQIRTQIEAAVFEIPSGNVRGYVTATLAIKGRSRRIAHATLLVNAAPSIYLEVPKTAPLNQIDEIADGLKAFAAKVRELCIIRPGQEG